MRKIDEQSIIMLVLCQFVRADIIVKPQPCGDSDRKWEMLKYLNVKAHSIALFNVTY